MAYGKILLVGAISWGAIALMHGTEIKMKQELVPKMPQHPVYVSQIQCSEVSWAGPTECHIYLGTAIGPEFQHKNVMQVLRKAKLGDTVVLHLQGYGGMANTTRKIINLMKASPAHIVARVEGNVYSAHAFLALAADEMQLVGRTTFLFHRGSLYKEVGRFCKDKRGKTDRGRDAEKKCQQVLQTLNRISWSWIKPLLQRALTMEEVAEVKDGADVIVTGETLIKRNVYNVSRVPSKK